jgi:hypothetical protein
MFVLACSTAMAKADSEADKSDILSMLPDDSLAFIVVRQPALLLTKSETLAKQLECPAPDVMAWVEKRLPAIQHVDMERPAAVVLHPGGTPLGGVILMPVTDFEAFVKACGAEDVEVDLVRVEFAGDEMVAASYNGYALLTDASDASAFKAVMNNQGRVAAEFAPMRARMEASDICGGATRSGIEKFTAVAKKRIEALQAEIMKRDDNELPGMPPKDVAEALSMYVMLVEELDTTVESYAFGMSIEKEAIVGQDILRLKASDFATKLGQVAPLAIDWYDQLPATRPVFVMALATPKSLMEGLLEFSKKAMLSMSSIYGMDEEEIHQLIEDSMPLMEKTNGIAFLTALPRNEEAPLYAGAGGLLKVDGDANQYIDDYAEMLTKMVERMQEPSEGTMLRFTAPKKLDIDGKAGLRFIAEIDLPVGPVDSAQKRIINDMMAKIYGVDGKLKIFMVAANDDTVAFGYTSRATVKRFVSAANRELPRRLGSMPAYKALRSHLPEDAQWVGAIDLGGYFQLLQRILPPGLVPDLDAPASPIGFGVTASEQEVCIHSVVTVHTAKRIAQVITRMIPAPSDAPNVETSVLDGHRER